MAKTKSKTEKIDIKYAQVVNSEKENHYVALANNLAFVEVSGDTVSVLDIDACGVDDKSGNLLTKVFLTKKGLNIDEIRGRYRRFKDNMSNLAQQNLSEEDRKKEIEKIEKNYLDGCRKIKVDFGYEKLLCIREWLKSKSSEGIFLQRFKGNTLERVERYRLQNI